MDWTPLKTARFPKKGSPGGWRRGGHRNAANEVLGASQAAGKGKTRQSGASGPSGGFMADHQLIREAMSMPMTVPPIELEQAGTQVACKRVSQYASLTEYRTPPPPMVPVAWSSWMQT